MYQENEGQRNSRPVRRGRFLFLGVTLFSCNLFSNGVSMIKNPPTGAMAEQGRGVRQGSEDVFTQFDGLFCSPVRTVIENPSHWENRE